MAAKVYPDDEVRHGESSASKIVSFARLREKLNCLIARVEQGPPAMRLVETIGHPVPILTLDDRQETAAAGTLAMQQDPQRPGKDEQ